MHTKQRILQEALRLFSRKGYDAVSVEQIADAVGVKAPSLYKHYKSKQDIFDAIFEETAKRYGAFTDSISVHLGDSAQDLQVFRTITADGLVEKVKSLISYSLHDEFPLPGAVGAVLPAVRDADSGLPPGAVSANDRGGDDAAGRPGAARHDVRLPHPDPAGGMRPPSGAGAGDHGHAGKACAFVLSDLPEETVGGRRRA